MPKHEQLNCSQQANIYIRPIDITEMFLIHDKEKYFTSHGPLLGMMFSSTKDMQAKTGHLPTGIDSFFDLRESIQSMFVFSYQKPRVSTLYLVHNIR